MARMWRWTRFRYRLLWAAVALSWICILLMHSQLDEQARFQSFVAGTVDQLLSNDNDTLVDISIANEGPQNNRDRLNGLKEIADSEMTEEEHDEKPFEEDIIDMDMEGVRPELIEKLKGELGEDGEAVIIEASSPEELEKIEEGWNTHQFNEYVSDRISVRRRLPDVRDEVCKSPGRYLENLPQTSIIITFYNEAWSVLLRTVHSIIDRSPKHLLKEIILIDDLSDLKDYDLADLQAYMKNFPQVRIFRNKKREGLMRSRVVAAKLATAPILTYIDSHCETTTGWLEPLLDVVTRSRTAVAVPVIDIINDDTFYLSRTQCNVQRGGLAWTLAFTWDSIRNDKREHKCDNLKSPTMAGGLFSIDKEYFKKIGYYDDKLEVWGGENIELSFKLWMCGGSIIIVPCSHVGHIFRKESPYVKSSSKKFGSYIVRNYDRVAAVWLDKHVPYYFEKAGRKLEDAGDISKALKLKEKLNCKSFQWYLDNIYPELYDIRLALYFGEIRNGGDNKKCVDNLGNRKGGDVGVYTCHKQSGNQYWSLMKDYKLRQDKFCLDLENNYPQLTRCKDTSQTQKWRYDGETQNIKNLHTGKCLFLDARSKTLQVRVCSDNKMMTWKFGHEHPKAIARLKAEEDDRESRKEKERQAALAEMRVRKAEEEEKRRQMLEETRNRVLEDFEAKRKEREEKRRIAREEEEKRAQEEEARRAREEERQIQGAREGQDQEEPDKENREEQERLFQEEPDKENREEQERLFQEEPDKENGEELEKRIQEEQERREQVELRRAQDETDDTQSLE